MRNSALVLEGKEENVFTSRGSSNLSISSNSFLWSALFPMMRMHMVKNAHKIKANDTMIKIIFPSPGGHSNLSPLKIFFLIGIDAITLEQVSARMKIRIKSYRVGRENLLLILFV